MIDLGQRNFFLTLLTLLIYPGDNLGIAFQPEFTRILENLTVPLGRDALFTCHVEHLGGYRVGWVKVDTKAIQAIHDHVITHNPRVSVSHGDHSTWNLKIKGVQREDAGLYMCQINTNPMKSQTAMLLVPIPPDFISDETSDDVTVSEGAQVKLKCRAKGDPAPRVSWRREDQTAIIIREPFPGKAGNPNQKLQGTKMLSEWHGEELWLTKISRNQMGVYHCIASNGVPPSIVKRIIVDVHFPPAVHVPNQLVGAPLGTDVTLECYVEASPQSINFWLNSNGVMIISSSKHEVQQISMQSSRATHAANANHNFKVKMILTIRNFTKQDVGTYKCAAKNSGGDHESNIRLYEIDGPLKSHRPIDPLISSDDRNDNEPPSHTNDDLLYNFGEIERSVNRPQIFDNTLQTHHSNAINQHSLINSTGKLKKSSSNNHHQQSSSGERFIIEKLCLASALAIIFIVNIYLR